MKVSMIIPVYGVEKYVGKCLESLVHQTYDDLEIIVVNDGSKDHSQDVIDQYKEKYPEKIVSLIKENGGLSDARNYGLPYATGEYIGFVDSDDWVELDMVEKMVNKAISSNADIVVSDIAYTWEDGSREDMILKGVREVENVPFERRLFLSPLFAWNKLYKKSFFMESGYRYPKGLWYEDIPVTVPLFAKAKKVEYVNEVLFHYLQREGSIMGAKYDDRMNHIFIELESVYTSLEKEGLLEKYHDEIEYLFIEHLLVYGAYRFLRTDHYRELLDHSFVMVEQYFPTYKKNPYISVLSKKDQIFLKTLSPLTYGIYKKYIESRDKKNG